MGSWTPRTPADGLRSRIFADRASQAASVSIRRLAHGALTGWMIPGSAFAGALCLALAPAAVRLPPPFVSAQEAMRFERSTIFAALQSAPAHSAANSLPRAHVTIAQVASFPWTNVACALSTNASFSGD